MADIDPRVTVIPVDQAALATVETPYTAFEHPYKDRPGRYARQADLMDLSALPVFWCVGDVWPAAARAPYHPSQIGGFISGMKTGVGIYIVHMWPEAVLYRTEVLQRCVLDPRMVYRPAAGAWTCLYERIQHLMRSNCRVMQEPIIDVPDRLVPTHEPIIPTIRASSAKLELSVIVVLDGYSPSIPASLTSLSEQALEVGSFEVIVAACQPNLSIPVGMFRGQLTQFEALGTRAHALNEAVRRAKGKRIAVWDLSCTSPVNRLARQLATAADIVGGSRDDIASDLLPYTHTNFSGRGWFAPGTLMLTRDVFERLGGFDEALPVHHEYDLQLRALGDNELTFAKLRQPFMVQGIADETCSEQRSYGIYCNLVARDITLRYFKRDGAHTWVDFEDES